jgi:hypothetical protein
MWMVKAKKSRRNPMPFQALGLEAENCNDGVKLCGRNTGFDLPICSPGAKNGFHFINGTIVKSIFGSRNAEST